MNRIAVNIIMWLVFATLSYNCIGQPVPDVKQVVIIRHAEKPEKGDNLSCKGLNRALELPAVLFAKFKLPDHIFVPGIKAGKSTNQSRMYQTIVPFAVKYNLDIDTRFDVEDTKPLADAIMETPGNVLVVWQHNNIPGIIQALGITDKDLKWNDTDYDTIWVITFKDGKAILSVDQENLKPGSNCN